MWLTGRFTAVAVSFTLAPVQGASVLPPPEGFFVDFPVDLAGAPVCLPEPVPAPEPEPLPAPAASPAVGAGPPVAGAAAEDEASGRPPASASSEPLPQAVR